MPTHDIIVIGASAGGVEALRVLVRALPAQLAAAVFIVLHIPPHIPSTLAAILNRAGSLPVRQAEDGLRIRPGQIYVAAPNHHLLVHEQSVQLSRGPRENRHRPAVDALFRSAAYIFGPHVVGVVLTGALDDGTAGLYAIKQRGGYTIVQDPNEAMYSSMPQSALDEVEVDECLPLEAIALRLVELAQTPVAADNTFPISPTLAQETEIAALRHDAISIDKHPGVPAPFSCPECKGVLWEVQEGQLVRYRCRTGHAYSTEILLAEQGESIEAAVWSAWNILEESNSLTRRMQARAQDHGHSHLVQRYAERIAEGEHQAKVLHSLLERLNHNLLPPGALDPAPSKRSHTEDAA